MESLPILLDETVSNRQVQIESCPARISLRVREHGRSKDACILLHGFGEGAYVWDSFAPSVAVKMRTIAIDFRGHGDSSWDPLARYNVEQHVADVIQVINSLELERYAIVGHSLGGAVAIRLAARRSDAVKGVLVVDYGPDLNPEGTARVRSDFRESMRSWDSIAEYAGWLRERRPLADESALSHLAGAALRLQPGGGFRPKADPALDAGVDDIEAHSAEVWRMLRDIAMPVTVVRGIGSAVLPANVVTEMMRVLTNGRVVTVRNSGHAVMSDNPDEFSRVLHSFISGAA
jgi:pimeloyl-ACP methyl ester carboxylesterase